ncbi:MAG: serine hydrolase [Kiritimatiellae bacterium]|nr:serine hydrolase [Kiritimatiellia bacterium]
MKKVIGCATCLCAALLADGESVVQGDAKQVAAQAPATYGAEWGTIPEDQTGIKPGTFASIPGFIKERNMGTTGMMIVIHGKVAYTFGDVKQVSYIASCRKSILDMLYGKYVANGEIDLNQTVGELGITDVGGLLPIETTATVRDLISARSGVYHDASNPGGIPEGEVLERGKTKPGTEWVYNNWDFNVAGTVFEKKTKQDIFQAFDRDFAKPLMLQDWNLATHKKTGDAQKSIHLAYHFWFSTRDMARLGELMLRKGKWNGRQLIPETWVEESTRMITKFEKDNKRKALGGYGYMWWVEPFGTDVPGGKGAYSAQGMWGQYITVIPGLDMVIAHKSANNAKHRTWRPDYYALVRMICEGAR